MGLMQDRAIGEQASNILRNVDVAVSGSTLLYARSLIEFYTKGRPAAQPTGAAASKLLPRPTDIVIEDLGTGVHPDTYWILVRIKASIDVHLMHLTAWRDLDYRSDPNNAVARPDTALIDWDREHPEIVLRISDALREAASRATYWQEPLECLHEAAAERLNDQNFTWPTRLTGKAEIYTFLDGLGL
jgi:hypothetical protein